jgi:phosphatidylglycerophosphatase A
MATFFGVGYFPFASGTLATAVALLPIYGIFRLTSPAFAPISWYWPNLVLAALLFQPGVWASGLGEDLTGERDSHRIVIDEVAGTLCALAFLPASVLAGWKPYVWAFFLFRLFDVWKPFPIRQSQILPRGWGVMVDDVLAGLLSGVILAFLLRFQPSWV